MTPGTTLVVAPGHRLQWEPAQGCHVLLYPEGLVELDETAAAVLGRLTAPTTLDALIAGLTEEYDGESLADDVRGFVEEARARGWITGG